MRRVIFIRENGTAYVSFRSMSEYGYPSLEEEKLAVLIQKIEALKG